MHFKTFRSYQNKCNFRHWIKDLREGMSILCVVVKKEKGAIILKCDPGKVNADGASSRLYEHIQGSYLEDNSSLCNRHVLY